MESGYINWQANSITQTIMANMQQEQSKYLSVLSQSEEQIMKAFELSSVAPTVDLSPTPDPPEPSVNASTNDLVQLEILKILKNLKIICPILLTTNKIAATSMLM